MAHFILLNTDRDSVKRLILNTDDGSATLQDFTRAGCTELHLTAEELEVVRTSCLLSGSDDPTPEQLQALDAFDALDALGYGGTGAHGEKHRHGKGLTMPHILALNAGRDLIKRLIHEPGGGATVQEFSKAGRVEIYLTAEELEIVRTGCLRPDCDCAGRDEQALDALTQEWRPIHQTLDAAPSLEDAQEFLEGIHAFQRHLDERDRVAQEPDARSINLDLDTLLLREENDDIPF